MQGQYTAGGLRRELRDLFGGVAYSPVSMKRIIESMVLTLAMAIAQAQSTGSFQTNALDAISCNGFGNCLIGPNAFQNDALLIQNAGVLSNANGYLDPASNSRNTVALIAGAGDLWTSTNSRCVGSRGVSNQWTISDAGLVDAGAVIGSEPPDTTSLRGLLLAATGGINGYDTNDFIFATLGLACLSKGICSEVQTGNSLLQLLCTPLGTVSAVAYPTNGGSVTGSGTYVAGSNVVVTAMPSDNWTFIKWNDGTTSNPYNIKVPGTNVAYTANFIPLSPTALAASHVTLNRFDANWGPVSGATNYLLDVSSVIDFSSYVSGYSNLTVGHATTCCVTGLNAGTSYYYRIREQQGGATSSDSPVVMVTTIGGSVSANNGPGAGGNTLVIMGAGIGDGSDITNVTVCGIVSEIQSQTANSVTVLVSAGSSGTGDIQVYSISAGMTTLPSSYTYNPQGTIRGTMLSWSSINNLPVGLNTHAAVTISNKIYAIGGQTHTSAWWTPVSTVYVYDPLNPAAGWGRIIKMPAVRQYVTGAAVSNKLYVIGGYEKRSVYEFDTQNPTAGWGSVSRLPSDRHCAAAAVVNGKVYVTGGSDLYGVWQATTLVYDPLQPAQGWLNLSNMPAARRFHSMTELGGKLYVVGGEDSSQFVQSDAWVYDPAQPTLGWLSISNLPAPRSSHMAAVLNGILYVIAGRDAVSNTPSVFMYDPSIPTQGWRNAASLPLPLSTGAATVAGGAIYAISGGYGGILYPNVFKGTLTGGDWSASGVQAGGDTVTITGSNLGRGDVTNVTLCGIAATVLTDNSPTQLVISSGAAVAPCTGDVVIFSTSYGSTIANHAYTYKVNLSVVANPVSGGSVTGGGSYASETNVQLTVAVSNNWFFRGWNDGDTNTSRTVTVPATNSTYTAIFTQVAPVTTLALPMEGGAVAGVGTYVSDSNAIVTTKASNNGVFMNWNGSVMNNPWTFAVPPGGQVCITNFSMSSTVNMLVNPINGGTAVVGGGDFHSNSNSVLIATASNGWICTSWQDGFTNSMRSIMGPVTNITNVANFYRWPPSRK